jgi:hypothetical protein
MEASRERNGNTHQGTLEIGRITVRKVSAFSSTKTAISMRVCGPPTAGMVKVLIGETKVESLGENTLVIGLRIRSMEEVLSSTRMVTDTMDSGLMACLKARAE